MISERAGKNEFSSCDVNITKMTADQVTNYMKGNEINVQMSRFNYFTTVCIKYKRNSNNNYILNFVKFA